MSPLLLAGLLAAGAFAQEPAVVRRGDIQIKLQITGNLAYRDVIRIKSAIEGRLDEVRAARAWMKPDEPLGVLANREMAAIYDSHLSSSRGTVERRWKQLYRPSPVACPDDCFVIRAFFGSKEWVNADSVLFEAARKVRLVGRIEPENAALVRDGMPLEFWPLTNPAMRLKGKIAHYALDPRTGGAFWMEMAPSRFLGTQAERWKGDKWAGEIVPLERKNVLIVPTPAVLRYNDVLYLPVRVSTGLTTAALTELTGGVEEKRPVLALGDACLKQAKRHNPDTPAEAIQRRLKEEPRLAGEEEEEEEGAEPAPPPGEAKPEGAKTPETKKREPSKAKARKGKAKKGKPKPAQAELKPPSDYGEDPYAD